MYNVHLHVHSAFATFNHPSQAIVWLGGPWWGMLCYGGVCYGMVGPVMIWHLREGGTEGGTEGGMCHLMEFLHLSTT